MKKLIILQGIPASGKSTWAKQAVLENTNFVRVCRDSLRRMRGKYWIPEQEGMITAWEDDCIEEALKEHHVIIDATNLNPKTIARWELIGKRFGAEIEFKRFDTPLEECLRRDALRGEEAVGEAVIKDFYYKYFTDSQPSVKVEPVVQNRDLRHILISDLDGSLCIHNGRNPFQYDQCDTDLPNNSLISVLESYRFCGGHVVFMSGREDFCKDKTTRWIKKHLPGFEGEIELYMRKTGDHRKDVIVKKELFDTHIKDRYYVEGIFDDRPQVIRMWRQLGLFVFDIGDGREF